MVLQVNTNKGRDISLDIIKIIATLFVIKLHSGEGGIASEVFHYICGTAIPLFLMVSGTLILNKDHIDLKYIGKKILNVIIIIVLWCVLLTAGKFLFLRKFENPLKYAIGAMHQQGMLSHFWYLWMLIIMYLISPVLFYLSKNSRGILWTTLIMLILCTVLSCNTLFYGREGFEAKTPQFLRAWTHITYFWCGGLIYRVAGKAWKYNKIEGAIKKYTTIVTAIFFVIVVSMAMLQYKILTTIISIHSPEYLFSNPIVICYNVVLFAILVVFLSIKTENEMKNDSRLSKIVFRLSRDSFGVYILHMFFIVALSKFIPEMNWALRFFLITIASFTASDIMGRIPIIRKFVQFS